MGFSIRGAVVLACVAVSIALTAGARRAHGQPAELPLAEIVKVAVRQSPDLERARIDVDAARAALLQAEGIEDVHVGAKAHGDRSGSSATDPLSASTSGQEVDVSASFVLPSGGTLAFTGFGARSLAPELGIDGKLRRVTSYIAGLRLSLTQPLLRGAGATTFEAPIRQAARQRDAAALSREARARDLLVSLAQAYWQVAFAWRQLEVRKGSLELAEKQLEHTLGAIRAEKVSRSEALAVQQAIAIRKQDVLAGEQELYERSVALRQLAGLEIGPDAIAVKTEPLPTKVDTAALDMSRIVAAAFEHSAELASLEAARRAAEVGVAAADGAAGPRLDLDVSGGPIGAANTVSDALSTATSDPGYTVSADLTFDVAIQRRAERGGQAAARAVLQGAKLTERQARARLAVRATRAVQRAQAALTSVALGDEAISLAEQNITAEQKRFELGKTTNFEVLRRQEELEQARLRHAAAVADYLSARADLDGLSGAILPRYGIVMQ
jgi:outer membrane protein